MPSKLINRSRRAAASLFFLESRKNFAPGCPINDDRWQSGPAAWPVFDRVGPVFCRSRRLPAFDSSTLDAAAARCTSPQRNTHISETREVHYPWHPWRGRCVSVAGSIEKRGRGAFHCYVEETMGKSALEIPAWMFDSACKQIRPADTPAVDYETLRSLKLLLARASSCDHIVKEAQRFEGGADEKTAKSKTISVGIVSAINPDADVAGNGSGGEGKGDTVAVSIVSPVSGKTEPPDSDGGRP